MLKWLEQNRLLLNLKKTQCVNFSIKNSRKNIDAKLALGNAEIEPCRTVKFLGVYIDNNLKFVTHVDMVCKKIASGIFVLRSLAKFSDINVLLAAYYGLIYPSLTYAVEVWGHECVRTSFVFTMQKKAIRAIFKKPCRFSCRSLFVDNRILTFPCIYIYCTLLYVHKHFSSFNNKSPQIAHDYSLRENNNIRIPSHRTSFFENHLTYNGVLLFNSLPDCLKAERNDRRFKKGLKDLLLTKGYYKVEIYYTDKDKCLTSGQVT